MLFRSRLDEIKRQDRRIEELEKDVRREWLIGYDEAHTETEKKAHHITDAQIDAAWKWVPDVIVKQRGMLVEPALAELGILRCEGCGGSGVAVVQAGPDIHEKMQDECPDCNGKGWEIHDDQE